LRRGVGAPRLKNDDGSSGRGRGGPQGASLTLCLTRKCPMIWLGGARVEEGGEVV
jgi:hypothetical protein